MQIGRQQGRTFWEKTVRELNSSGLSRRRFAEQRRLKRRTLDWWCWRLKAVGDRPVARRSRRRKLQGARFIEVAAPVIPTPMTSMRIRVGAMTVEFDNLPPAAYVRDLAREVAPC
jgi:hypothetical protein